jgi:hypothetical protein
MKKKIKRYAEGKAVTTRSDDEIEFSSKNPYKQYPGEGWKEREKEQGEKNLESLKSFGRKLFGGGDDESKFSDLESVKKTKTLKEQIGRKDEEEPRRKITDYSTNKGTTTVSKEDAPYEVEKTTPPKKEAPPKVEKPKKSFAEDAKPLPGKSSAKEEESKPLPGKKEKEKKPTPYKDVVKAEDVGSQSFASPKKEPPLRKVGRAIKGTLENANKPFRSSMYDKMKGRKDGGTVQKYAKGGSVSSASSRGDGIAMRGKTKGKIY